MQQAPAGVGTVAFAADAGGITATLTGSTLRPDTHSVAILLVDAATGVPCSLDYGFTTARAFAPDGTIATVRLPFTPGQVTGPVRAYVMVDAYPAATETLTIPVP